MRGLAPLCMFCVGSYELMSVVRRSCRAAAAQIARGVRYAAVRA